MTRVKHYPEIEPNPSFPKIEENAQEFWQRKAVFQASVDGRAAEKGGVNNEFIFYDGPPFANGLPHYGHLLTGYVKDLFARYQTMKGKRVERRFGWDCHGLPAEMGAEKELNISGRAAIMNYGIGNFNEYCRSSVMKYAHEWEHYVTRQGRWVDFKNDYKTMNTPYMESVLWAFKQLYDKGLVYESLRVMPYSWAAETPLSNFETKLDNSYREREDKAITVAFELDKEGLEARFPNLKQKCDRYYLLAWTTTPWTLPSNLALAVNKEMEYVTMCVGSNCYIVANGRHGVIETALEKEIKTAIDDFGYGNLLLGSDLIGLSYKPLFPYFADHQPGKAFRIIDGTSFVTDADGTGIVHIAPGFGEDDQRVAAEHGISIVCPVDGTGRYTDEIFDLPRAAAAPAEAILHTERLYLRPFRAEDYELYRRLQSDPKVAATTSDGLLPEDKIRAEFDRFQNDQRTKGFTQWAAFRKEDGAFIGRAGLDNRDYDQFNTSGKTDVELRYALLSEYWGKGYATELSVALIDWAWANIAPELIIAGCNPSYPAAVNVLKKLGFASHHHVPFRNQTVWYHTLERAQWNEMRPKLQPASLPPLSLKGLNVIAQTEGQCADEPYKPEQLKKFGLVNLRIINWLKLRGALIKQEDFKHNYPHCWRTDTPLIYRAMPSWYVAVTKFRDRAVELNQQINWIPAHIKDGQMGHMLATAPDWSISRNRFWGTPIPVWRSDNPNNKELYVFGSIAELEAFFGQKVDDLHRPHIDNLTKPDPFDAKYTLHRVEDVFDCWFESGSMPFAQVHYPFENKEWFHDHFPADFITEYVGQTRGWFNTLIMLSTALFDKPPFKNCICHGVVLDAETGLKYSKRLKNYKDPLEVIGQFGADALRWLMIASPVMRGSDLMVDPEGKFIRDVVRLSIKPIWNAYHFFCLYANADGVKAELLLSPLTSPPQAGGKEGGNLMDRYILAKCSDAAARIEASLDAYDTPSACEAVEAFFEVLNNWYIRRNKERFWRSWSDALTPQQQFEHVEWSVEEDKDKQAAYNTLYTVLHVMCRAAAPLLPMTLEEIYRGLTGGESSVHLADFPSGLESATGDDSITRHMDMVRQVCEAAHAIRNRVNIRVRQPLQSLTVIGSAAEQLVLNPYYEKLIMDEVNVKQIAYVAERTAYADLRLQINLPVLGKRRPEIIKLVTPAAKKGEWRTLADGRVEIAGQVLEKDECTVLLEAKADYKDRAQPLSSNDALVVLDIALTPELEAEGIARDVVRMIQQARKDAGLDVSDRIVLSLDAPDAVKQAVETHKSYIAEQTLAESLSHARAGDALYSVENDIDGSKITIALSKAA